jgi:hypothetical protein
MFTSKAEIIRAIFAADLADNRKQTDLGVV